MVLPAPRGPVSDRLMASLRRPLHRVGSSRPGVPVDDEDLQLALYVCYELHYRGLAGVDAEWEWEPSLLELRRELERRFESHLRERIPTPVAVAAEEMDVALRAIEAEEDGPSLSLHLQRHGTLDEFREFMIHRSAYQLKEADPHSWALPRLHGAPKAAMVEIQTDEYGGGDPERMHSALFARSMAAVDLDPTYGAYVDQLPGVTLATVNLMSMFGLHRRLRGAVVGHLALFEMTSSLPNRRYAEGLRRLGCGGDTTGFYDEHVVADAVHESIAAVDLAGGLARQQPDLAPDILWGATALRELDADFGHHLLDCWQSGRSSLAAHASTALV